MIKLVEKEYYEALLPTPQNPGGINSNKRIGVLYRGTFKENSFEVAISPFPGLSTRGLEESCQSFEECTGNIKNFYHPNPHVEWALYQIFNGPFQDRDIKENDFIALNDITKEQRNLAEVIKTKIKKSDSTNFRDNIISSLKSLTNSLGSAKLVRLDANMGLTIEELIELWNILKSQGLDHLVDYFEEPLRNFFEYADLPSDLPFAHEEHLNQYLKTPTKARSIVLKPSQTGVSVLKNLRNDHPELKLIISSAFDFDSELPALKELAFQYSPLEYHGLKALLSKSKLKHIKTIKFS